MRKVLGAAKVKDIVAACAKGTAPVMDGSCQGLKQARAGNWHSHHKLQAPSEVSPFGLS